MTDVLQIEGLSKRYGSVQANQDITLRVGHGEIVALLGENGAGKSTLVKQIFGLTTPDSGKIVIKGDDRPIQDPTDAISRGVGMVHQHFQLVPVMTVTENVMLGDEPIKAGRLDFKSARQKVQQISQRYGLAVDPDALIEDLPVGTQQRVEIIKALSKQVDLLILDEPTAVLTPQETDELLGVMRELAAAGTAIVFITHKLREVLAVADRVYVLRRGTVVGEVQANQTDAAQLAELMVGRPVLLDVDKTAAQPGEEVLRVESLQVADDRGTTAVNGIDLTVRAGEIVGIAGVEGNGQRELVEALAGMRHSKAGQISVAGRKLTNREPDIFHDAGVGHIPEDRERHGLVAQFSIADNLVLNRVRDEQFRRSIVRDEHAIADNGRVLVEQFDIRAASEQAPAASLSGGNKQKVVVAREMSANPKLLLAAQPTRGVDVGSIEFIHRRIIDARDAGAGVLLVSAELDEIMSVSDRILVIHQGKIVGEMPAAGADASVIGQLMAGNPVAAGDPVAADSMAAALNAEVAEQPTPARRAASSGDEIS